eukprot:COSAG02_NODE_4529_length_5254_cov_2.860524_2_plen_507_part_00
MRFDPCVLGPLSYAALPANRLHADDAVRSQTCSLCDEVENAKIRQIDQVPWGCPRCIYWTSCTVAGRTQVVHCADGHFKTDMSNHQSSDTCTACTPVEDATSITCTETGNSRATCAPGMFKTDNSATTPSQSDTCTACTPVPGATSIECDGTGNTRAQCGDGLMHVDNTDAGTSDMCCTAVEGAASVTCTAVGNSRATCDQGRYVTDNSADGTSDTCTPCPHVDGAHTVTCTAPDNVRAQCNEGSEHVNNEARGVSDECTPCGGDTGTRYDFGRCTPCTEIDHAASVICDDENDSRVVECEQGYYKNHQVGEVCAACQPVDNAATVECENGFESEATTCEEGYSLEGSTCMADGPVLPPPPPPPPTKIVATLTLDGDVETVAGAGGSEEREAFETAFKTDVATTIGVNPIQISIVSITAASVEVVFEVLPQSDGVSVELSVVQDAFADVIELPTVGVSTTGAVAADVETIQEDDNDIDLNPGDKTSSALGPGAGALVALSLLVQQL